MLKFDQCPGFDGDNFTLVASICAPKCVSGPAGFIDLMCWGSNSAAVIDEPPVPDASWRRQRRLRLEPSCKRICKGICMEDHTPDKLRVPNTSRRQHSFLGCEAACKRQCKDSCPDDDTDGRLGQKKFAPLPSFMKGDDRFQNTCWIAAVINLASILPPIRTMLQLSNNG